MTFTVVEVAGANFRTDEAADELNTEFMKRLGMRKRYLPARLALSRSLGVPTPPESLAEGSDWGKTIKGDTLFGTFSAMCRCSQTNYHGGCNFEVCTQHPEGSAKL